MAYDFDKIAHTYDRLNRLMTMGLDCRWRRKAARRVVNPAVPQKILDEACGTGDMARDLLRCAHPGSRLTGIDLSEQMLAMAEKKLKGKNAVLMQCDAEKLPFDDSSFDIVTIAFGIRNYVHRAVALLEIQRVLKPDGRLLILELSIPDNPVLRWLWKQYAFVVIPLLGGLVTGRTEAYRYLPESIVRFPAPKQFLAELREAGFRQTVDGSYTWGVCRVYEAKKE